MSEASPHPELDRFVAVMARLRVECPWDARQTHESLVHYLVEETCEVVEAIEAGNDDDLREELGDLLLQVIFHAGIAAEQGRFGIDEVARGVAEKLIARHPWVFSDEEFPDDVNQAWEVGKKAEKSRKSSLDGIPERLSALARADKVIARASSHGIPVELSSEPITAAEVGAEALQLVSRARASGIDAEQAVRAALRELEGGVRRSEAPSVAPAVTDHRLEHHN